MFEKQWAIWQALARVKGELGQSEQDLAKKGNARIKQGLPQTIMGRSPPSDELNQPDAKRPGPQSPGLVLILDSMELECPQPRLPKVNMNFRLLYRHLAPRLAELAHMIRPARRLSQSAPMSKLLQASGS